LASSSRPRWTSSFQKALPPSISVSPGLIIAARSASVFSVISPAGSMIQIARGACSFSTISLRSPTLTAPSFASASPGFGSRS
jgi:hypothetical protein